jgi:hypothetical protein
MKKKAMLFLAALSACGGGEFAPGNEESSAYLSSRTMCGTDDASGDDAIQPGETIAPQIEIKTVVKGCVNGTEASAELHVCLVEQGPDGAATGGALGNAGIIDLCVDYTVGLRCQSNRWQVDEPACTGEFCDGFEVTMADPAFTSCGWKIVDLTVVTSDGVDAEVWTAGALDELDWEPLPFE